MRPITSHVPNFNIPLTANAPAGKKRSISPDRMTDAKRSKCNEEHVAFPKRNGFDGLHRLQRSKPLSAVSTNPEVPPKSPGTLRRETEERVKEKGRTMSEARVRAQVNVVHNQVEVDNIEEEASVDLEGLMENDIFTPMTPESDSEAGSKNRKAQVPVFTVNNTIVPDQPATSAASPLRVDYGAAARGSGYAKSSPADRRVPNSADRRTAKTPTAPPSNSSSSSHRQSPTVYESREHRRERMGLLEEESPNKSMFSSGDTPAERSDLDAGLHGVEAGNPAPISRHPSTSLRRDTPESLNGDSKSVPSAAGEAMRTPSTTAIERAQEKSRADVQARLALRREEEEQSNRLKSSVRINVSRVRTAAYSQGIHYTTIGEAKTGSRGSLMGIIIEYPKTPTKSRGRLVLTGSESVLTGRLDHKRCYCRSYHPCRWCSGRGHGCADIPV